MATMVELIENTLQIITKLSSSSSGYLLKLSGDGFKVFKAGGTRIEDFDVVNEYLFNLHLSDGIDDQTIQLSKLINNNSIASYFIKNLFINKENNQAVYILLFSENANGFNSECKKNINSIIPILSQQVKSWIRQNDLERSNNKIVIGNDVNSIVKENGLLSNWEENFNSLLEASPDLVFILDKEGKFLLLNKTGFELLEYSLNHIEGKHLTEFVDPEDYNKVTQQLSEAIIHKGVQNFEVSLLTKYEKVIPFEISCKVLEKNGEIIGLLGIGRNVIEQKNFEIELKKLKPKILEINRLLKIEKTRSQQKKSLIDELNRLKQEFVSNISHEFRTPLASIIGFSETIESDPDLPPEMKKEFNKVILNEGKRLAKLINNILNLSKFESADITISRNSIDGVKLVNEIVDSNRDFAAQKNITLTVEAPKERIEIEADKERLNQALNALLNNAIKFTNEYGRVKIIVSNLIGQIEIIISDTGIGIPEKDLPYIFQRFYRVSRPGSEIPGIGVGLVFVKHIVDLHKGLITVQSDIEKGTTFVVKLPKTSKIEKT